MKKIGLIFSYKKYLESMQVAKNLDKDILVFFLFVSHPKDKFNERLKKVTKPGYIGDIKIVDLDLGRNSPQVFLFVTFIYNRSDHWKSETNSSTSATSLYYFK